MFYRSNLIAYVPANHGSLLPSNVGEKNQTKDSRRFVQNKILFVDSQHFRRSTKETYSANSFCLWGFRRSNDEIEVNFPSLFIEFELLFLFIEDWSSFWERKFSFFHFHIQWNFSIDSKPVIIRTVRKVQFDLSEQWKSFEKFKVFVKLLTLINRWSLFRLPRKNLRESCNYWWVRLILTAWLIDWRQKCFWSTLQTN